MKREVKWLFRQGVGLAGKALVKTFGHAVMLPDGYVFSVPPTMDGLSYASLTLGRYEKAELEILRNHFRNVSNILEVGANIGIVSRVAMDEKLLPEGTIVCVEPNPRARKALKDNLERSFSRDASKIFYIDDAALAGPQNDGGTATFMMRPNLSSGLASHTNAQRREEAVSVPLRSLSRLLDSYGMQTASLVCDAEGAEIDMLLDTKGLARIDQMAIELHETSLTGRADMPPARVLLELQKQGFVVGARASNTWYLHHPDRLKL